MTPFKFFVGLTIASFVLACALCVYVLAVVSDGLPSLEKLENPNQNLATQVLSSDGKVIDHFFIQRRVAMPFDSIPPDFLNALVSTEDRTFYDHWGINVSRIITAGLKNVFSFRITAGASTITMQLARNLYFKQENTLNRKLKEAFTAIQIEKSFTKKEIIALYANTVNFGRGAYGIQVASQEYFDKPPNMLTLAECAFLVGLLKAPEHYNGIINPEKAIQRRNIVLKLMKDQGVISQDQFFKASEEPLTLSRGKFDRHELSAAPHFVEMVRQQLSKDPILKDYDLYRDGLIIHTTLNSKIQEYAEQAVEQHLATFQEIFNRAWSWSRNAELLNSLIRRAVQNLPAYVTASPDQKKNLEEQYKKNKSFVDSVKNAATTVQVGVTVIEPATGAILAMVGASPKFMKENPDAKYSLNHVTQIRRQPGSSFKPFVYASALEKGMKPQSTIDAGPFSRTLSTGEVWSPKGYGKDTTVTLFKALSSSINSVSARLITSVTSPEEVIALAKKMGIESQLHAVPALALGAGGEVSPFEMVSAYCTFANEGIAVKPYFINSIEDQFGNVLYEKNRVVEAKEVLSPDIAHQMTYMMQGVINSGTAYDIKKYVTGFDAAGKTGTTNDYADAWFLGFSPQLVGGVWVGFDDRRLTFTGEYGYGAKAAAPIWGIMMNKIYNDESLPYKQRRFLFTGSGYGDSTLLNQKPESWEVPTKPPAIVDPAANKDEPAKTEKPDKLVQADKPKKDYSNSGLPKLPKKNEAQSNVKQTKPRKF
jgi:penicillin-binding protein 1A